MEFSTIHSWFLDVYGFHEKNIFLATRKSVEISMTRNSRAFLAGDSNFMELKCGQRIKTSVFVGGIVHSTRGFIKWDSFWGESNNTNGNLEGVYCLGW